MNISALNQSLEPGQLVEMFVVDLNPIGVAEVLRFFDGVNSNGDPIVWQGQTYTPWPVRASGFDVTTSGTLPRPSLEVANVYSTLIPYLEDYDDLVGAQVIRKRTYAQFLDGMPGADPYKDFEDDVYFIERKTRDDGTVVGFELASVLDLAGERLPAREISVDRCDWDYRGDDCPYRGSAYFDVHDQPVASLNLDVCSKRPSGCKARFGVRAVLPFGGFVAAKVYKV